MKIDKKNFRIRNAIINKGLLKMGVLSLLLFFLLCSCNKNDGNAIDDIEVVNKGESTSEDISNPNVDDALTKVQNLVKTLKGIDDVETSERLERILSNMKEIKYSHDDDKIIIDGTHNSYMIKLGSDNDGKEKILYECYYTDILNSDNGDFTCYINDFFSVCVVDNKNNEIIFNKYIDLEKEFSEEDFKFDNKRVFSPGRMQVMETGWIKSSNMAYFACYDMSNIFFVIDIDKKIVSQPNFTTGRGIEDFIDKDKGYIVSGDTNQSLDTDSYMIKQMEKQYNHFYLINLFTLEKFEIAKSIREKIEPQIENDKTISYIASSGERVTVDISHMIGKDRALIREELIDTLYSQLNLEEGNNVNLHKFNDIVYAVVDNGENKTLIQFTENNKVNIIADNLEDINFSELGKYISLYNKNNDLIVLDKYGNKYLENNVFNYVSNNDTGIELGLTVWGKNNDKLYILTKKDDSLSNIFEVNMIDKSIRDLASDIDCRYENIYIDASEGYVVYSTFPGPIFYSYNKEVEDDVCLYVKYFNSGEKVEIARSKGESIHFYIFDNELKYYCRENDYVEGTYVLDGDVPVNIDDVISTGELLLPRQRYTGLRVTRNERNLLKT